MKSFHSLIDENCPCDGCREFFGGIPVAPMSQGEAHMITERQGQVELLDLATGKIETFPDVIRALSSIRQKKNAKPN